MTEEISDAPEKSAFSLSFSLPVAMLIFGVLLIGASFLPFGNWAAQSQWTPADSAAFDRVSNEYKLSAYQSPTRAGLSQAEWDAQRGKMQQQMLSLQHKLERAKGQPQRWSRYLLGVGCLLAIAGFYANATRHS